MAETALDLDEWLRKIKQAASRQEVFRLLDEFRPLAWTDEQRALMASTYQRLLQKMQKSEAGAAAAASSEQAADGPVWYEKM